VLFLVPWLDTSRVRSARFRPLYRVFFWLLMAAWLVLAYCGSKPPEGAYLIVTRIAAVYYFVHFLIVLPLIGLLETPSPLPISIAGAPSTRRQAVARKPVRSN
jgi:quinol-cytochrome oxidoreductase complex cytochrome b subunit